MLLLVLHHHRGREQLARVVRDPLQSIEHPPTDLVAERAGLDRGQQRQRRTGGAGVLERVVERIDARRQDPGAVAVARAQQPQLLLLADVREVPHQRAHQRIVLSEQVRLVQIRQHQRAVPGALQLADDLLKPLPGRVHNET